MAEKHFDKNLIPKWCQEYNLFVCNDGGENLAVTKTEYKYRRISVTLYGDWFTLDDEAQKEVLTHEQFHGFVSVLYNFAKEKLGDDLQSDLYDFDEMVVQDLTYAYLSPIQKGRSRNS